MYERYYGFTAKPFGKTPDPRFLYLSKTHEEALARLHYAVDEREIVILTGEIGSGKTTLTRALMDSLDERYRVALIVNPRLTSLDFLRTVYARLGCEGPSDSKSALLDSLYAKFYEDYRKGITPVVIIDEAHLIPYRETFEEIRLLTNFQLDDMNLLSLILAGQTDLRKKLNAPALRAFRQRIGMFYHLEALTGEEVRSYLLHRAAVGGGKGTIFTDAAARSIYTYAQGVPRVINSLANMSLLEGFARDAAIIDEDIVTAAAREIGLNGYS